METLAEFFSLILLGAGLLVLVVPLAFLVFAMFSTSIRNGAGGWRQILSRWKNRIRRQNLAEARKAPRITTKEVRAEISDGRTIYSGLVANISTIGLCITHVPVKLSSSNKVLSIVLRNRSNQCRVVARLRWERPQAQHGKIIGAEVAAAPDNWHDFVLSC